MGISDTIVIDASDQYYEPLLQNSRRISHGDQEDNNNHIMEGVVNYRGEKVSISSNYGGWRSASLIIGAEIGETIAYYGISSNLINYLTGPLGQSTVVAAANINAWSGVVWMLPLLGAFISDSYLGRFRTIIFSSIIYVLGLGLLTLSVVLPDKTETKSSSTSPSSFRVISFFFPLYLVAIGKAGFKPCAEAFGADQFDVRNPKESTSKSSFFNWWYFGLCIGSSTTRAFLTYIEDNVSWGLAFGIACISMLIGFIVFLLGLKTYRFNVEEDKAENPLFRIARVFSAAARNWRTTSSSTAIQEQVIPVSNDRFRVGAHQFKFLDKALIDTPIDSVGSMKHGKQCSIDQVEDAKAVLRLVPIWIMNLLYAVVCAQSTTFFTKQGSTMDRTIGPAGIQIPAASFLTFIPLSVILIVPIYDRVLVPLSRLIICKPHGITMLQRIGCGLFLSTICMVVAAIVEKKRLQVALDAGLIDMPEEIVPMSLWWLLPQYLLLGLAEVFAMIGLQEFFYDQVPDDLKSMGLSLFFSIFGIGDFLSGFMISTIDKFTSRGSQYSWFSNNLNRAHLDYFYWLLAGLGAVNLAAHLYFSKSYLYRRGPSM